MTELEREKGNSDRKGEGNETRGKAEDEERRRRCRRGGEEEEEEGRGRGRKSEGVTKWANAAWGTTGGRREESEGVQGVACLITKS